MHVHSARTPVSHNSLVVRPLQVCRHTTELMKYDLLVGRLEESIDICLLLRKRTSVDIDAWGEG